MGDFFDQMHKAEHLIELGRYDQGIAILNELAHDESMHTLVLPFLFNIHIHKRDLRSAKKVLKLMQTKYGAKKWTLISASYYYGAKLNFKKSLSYAEMALEQDPEDQEFLVQAASSACELRQLNKAENFLKLADEQNPEDFNCLIAWIQFHTYRLDKVAVEKVLDRALKLYPEEQALLNIKTRLVIDKGKDMSEAAELAEMTLLKDPSNEDARSTLLLYLKNKNKMLKFFAGNSFNRYKIEWTPWRVILMVLFWKGTLLWGGFGLLYLLVTWYGGVLYNSLIRLHKRYKLLLNSTDIMQSNVFLKFNGMMVIALLIKPTLEMSDGNFSSLLATIFYALMIGISFFEIESKSGKWLCVGYFGLTLYLIVNCFDSTYLPLALVALFLLIYAFCFTLNLIFN